MLLKTFDTATIFSGGVINLMEDATLNLLASASKGNTTNPTMFMMFEPIYNIDDMDGRIYMADRRMSGCYGINSTKQIDPAHPGTVFINGVSAGSPIICPNKFADSYLIGLPLRKMVREYDAEYIIRYEGAIDTDGMEMLPFEFIIKTLPKVSLGEKYPEHDKLVLQAAREGTVLMKNNNNTLPFTEGSVVNAFGKGGPLFRLGCVGAGKINPRYGIRFEEGIKSYSKLILNEELFDFYRNEEDLLPPPEVLKRASNLNNTAVIVITRGTGEAIDTRPEEGEFYLTDDEDKLIKSVCEHFEKTVVVLNTGYPIDMRWVDKYGVDTLLWCGLSGMSGGRALAEILEGIIAPSGKLPDTWAYDYYDHPSSRNFYSPSKDLNRILEESHFFVNTIYEEDIYVGYRYFETFNKPVAYPFGHGLSYTSFSKECISFTETNCHVNVQVKVTNIGNRKGKEVVLIFAEISDGKLEQPTRRLVAFGKTDELAPKADEILSFDIIPDRFSSYDENSASWLIEEGKIALYLGGSVRDAIKFEVFAVKHDMVLHKVKNRIQPPIKIDTLSKKDHDATYPKGKITGFIKAKELPYRRLREKTPEMNPIVEQKPSNLITFPMVIDDPKLLGAFVAQLSDYELCRMSVGGRTGWGIGDNGFAGMLYREGVLERYQIPEYYMADGNNGLNMNEANIGFPVSNVMCATFNELLSFEEGRAIGIEAIDMGLHNILAPAMNLHRNPLCGRHSEYFSEDPYLAGRMGGMESKGLESIGVTSTMKHFIANNAEFLRQNNHSILTERAARELYLYVFEVAFEVNEPDTIMSGFNPSNGCWCAGDEELLKGILRDEWGYKGYVMTDWNSYITCPPAQYVQAGNSWMAPGSMDDTYVMPLIDALQDGSLDRERLKRNVYDMYAVITKHFRKVNS